MKEEISPQRGMPSIDELSRPSHFSNRKWQTGRIRYYGVSSNTVTAHPADAEATSLSRMCDAGASRRCGTRQRPPPFRRAAMPHESL